MPRTPPINLPENNANGIFSDDFERFLMEDDDMSSVQETTRDHASQENGQDALYHKSSQQPPPPPPPPPPPTFEIMDEEHVMDPPNKTLEEEPTFDHAIEEADVWTKELRTEFERYVNDVTEFKRNVESAKQDLMDFIHRQDAHFQDRNSFFRQKLECLRNLI